MTTAAIGKINNDNNKRTYFTNSCKLELSNYDSESIPLFDKEGTFNNSLVWWKQNE